MEIHKRALVGTLCIPQTHSLIRVAESPLKGEMRILLGQNTAYNTNRQSIMEVGVTRQYLVLCVKF